MIDDAMSCLSHLRMPSPRSSTGSSQYSLPSESFRSSDVQLATLQVLQHSKPCTHFDQIKSDSTQHSSDISPDSMLHVGCLLLRSLISRQQKRSLVGERLRKKLWDPVP